MTVETVIVIPSFNERENIGLLLEELMALEPSAAIVVVDDCSPDGTGDVVRRLQESNPQIYLLHPPQHRGRGAAAILGLAEALRKGGRRIVEMDADLSHQPRFVPDLLAAAEEFDLVIGSRFVPGGSDVDRGWLRRTISLLAGRYIRTLMGLQVQDPTSGFRCYRREVLERVELATLVSTGPSELLEVLLKTVRAGFRVGEVPIAFVDRSGGRSKLGLVLLLETMLMVPRLVWRYGRNGPLAASRRR